MCTAHGREPRCSMLYIGWHVLYGCCGVGLECWLAAWLVACPAAWLSGWSAGQLAPGVVMHPACLTSFCYAVVMCMLLCIVHRHVALRRAQACCVVWHVAAQQREMPHLAVPCIACHVLHLLRFCRTCTGLRVVLGSRYGVWCNMLGAQV